MTGTGTHHLDDVMKALYKIEDRNIHVMGNIANPGSAYIVFTGASGKAIDIYNFITRLFLVKVTPPTVRNFF